MPRRAEFGTGDEGALPNGPMGRNVAYGEQVKKRDSWGPAVAAIVLGVLAVIVVVAFYLGVRGLFSSITVPVAF